MKVALSPEAQASDDALFDAPGREYESVWDVIERIQLDPDEAKHANWTNFVSTFGLWGTKVPGTDLTVFWRVHADDVLEIALIERDRGL